MAVWASESKMNGAELPQRTSAQTTACVFKTDLRRRLAIGVFKKIQNTWRYMIGNLTDYL